MKETGFEPRSFDSKAHAFQTLPLQNISTLTSRCVTQRLVLVPLFSEGKQKRTKEDYLVTLMMMMVVTFSNNNLHGTLK